VDVVVECSSAIVEAAQFVLAALERGKTVVLVNAEVDLAFGPLFSSIARSRGVVCTSADGDQHGVIKRLVDDLTLWGFDLAMAGNIKGFLNREADPENTRPEADKRKLDYRMCQALELFDLDALRSGGAVVDYVLGAQPDGGVFAIGHCEHPYQRDMMAYYKMGPGPYYVFYRPYHLCHIELMAGLVAAHLDGEALLEPAAGFRTDVYAWAKRDLKAGEVLDGVGGFTCYGMIENCDGPWLKGHLPICLSEGLRVKRDIPKDAPIALRDVAYDPSIPAFALHARARECTGG
jgi:predicted homoserine dehydrogenase-like protein